MKTFLLIPVLAVVLSVVLAVAMWFGAPAIARLTHATLRKLFRWAVSRGEVTER